MWVKKGENQTIVFIDPKGLIHSKGLNNEKIKFAGFLDKDDKETVTIKQIEQRLGKKKVVLGSFILSDTHYEDLIKDMTPYPSKDEYIKHHVLFLHDTDSNWPEILFSNILF